MVDVKRSEVTKSHSILVVGLTLAFVGTFVLLLSDQFESATSVNATPVGANLLFAGIVASMYGARRSFPEAQRLDIQVAGALLLVGSVLLLIGTPVRKFVPVETEVLGVIATIAGVGIGIAALRTMRRRGIGFASFAEKSSVVSAMACIVIIVLLSLALQGALLNPDAGTFALKVILLSAAVIVIESVARSFLSRSELETNEGDERDAFIRQRAAAAAHTTLLTFLVPLVVLIALVPESWAPKVTTTSIGLQVLIVVMLSELVRHITSVHLYRRDRA